MLSLSIEQALNCWTELARAYYGDNKFGGKEAEIYAYTLAPTSSFHHDAPCRTLQDAQEDMARMSAHHLNALLSDFTLTWGCRAFVDGQPFSGQVERSDHRYHVRIERLDGKL